MKRGTMRSNLDGLKNLGDGMRALSGGRLDVGFFGDKAARTQAQEKKGGGRKASKVPATMTNAQVAAVHEFGSFSQGIPKRSMLRMPFFLKGKEVLAAAHEDMRANWSTAVGKIDPLPAAKLFLQRLGVAAENLVQEAFKTEGFGTWAPNSPLTVFLKGSDKPLIDTAQLRRAVASRAVI